MKKWSQTNFIPWRLGKEQYRNTKDQKYKRPKRLLCTIICKKLVNV